MNGFPLVILFVFLITLLVPSSAQNIEDENWAGNYRFINPDGTLGAYFEINADKPMDPNKVAVKLRADLLRWTISIKSEPDWKESLRRFLANEEDNEYEQFGWTDLHAKKEISCLDAGHFIICRTEENKSLKIFDEQFTSRTGMFGVRLHYGFFEFMKIED